MNSQAIQIAPLMLLIFFGSAQAKLVNSNVDVLSNESNLMRISRTPTVIGDQLFLAQAVFVSKATDSNNLDIKHSTPSVKATAFNTDAIDTNDLTKKSEYFNKRRVADAGSQIGMAIPSGQPSGISDFLTPTTRFIEKIGFFPVQNWQTTMAVFVSSIKPYDVNIENIFVVSSNAIGDLVLIAKKAIILSLPSASLISSVSLTTTVWMFGAALMGFLAYCKRNNAI